MRLPIALAAAPLLILLGCTDSSAPTEPAAPRDRPLGQDGTIERSITSTPDRARVQLDLANARTAVKAWRADHGAWPASLGEAGVEGLNYPADLAYDASTGAVTSQTYPGY